MRDQVYRALAERCGGLVARQEALTAAHYQRWLGELEEGQGAESAAAAAAAAAAIPPWEACAALADVDFDALLSIYLQCYKHHVRKNAHRHRDPAAVAGMCGACAPASQCWTWRALSSSRPTCACAT